MFDSIACIFVALQEARDCLLGRLFAYGALARSGRLAEEWNRNPNTPYIKEITSLIIALAAKKRYLQEPAVSVILDLIEKVNIPVRVKYIFVFIKVSWPSLDILFM